MNPAGFPNFNGQICSFIVYLCGVVMGVATWHGHMMLHVMVVTYNHFQGTKLANLSYGALISRIIQNCPPRKVLSKPVPLYNYLFKVSLCYCSQFSITQECTI